jgi:ABC-type multidrug transport system ATPase subunit
MLDASTRVDVLNLLADLKARGLAILFITHDLSLGSYISERTMILRRGRIVELGPTERSSAIRGIRTRRRSSPRFRSWPVEVTTGSEDSAALVDVGGGHLVALSP